jgi:hypothetical protein
MKVFSPQSIRLLIMSLFLVNNLDARHLAPALVSQQAVTQVWIPMVIQREMNTIAGTEVLLAAGDIADCNHDGDEQTALLVEAVSGMVATLGDNVYESGTAEEFATCFAPSWGRFKDRIRPSPGNHEYETPGAQPYYEYFGPAAGEAGKGYYSYDLGAWHIVALNSNCQDVPGGCGPDSPQVQWLQEDLATHPSQCSLAYWHHPFYSSGDYGSHVPMRYLWQVLVDHGVDVVLSGHEHSYERFAPQDGNGNLDTASGIVQFVVGTGGRETRSFPRGNPEPNSLVRNDETFGVLELTLHPDHYEWSFLGVPGSTFTDTGNALCYR